MTTMVVDASAALAWLIPAQSTPASDTLLRCRDDLDLSAPDIFGWEVTNVLLGRARSTPNFDLPAALAQLAAYRIDLDPPLSARGVADLAEAARAEGLSLFDAAYLSLTMEQGAGLASKDRALLRAAARHGLIIHDLNA